MRKMIIYAIIIFQIALIVSLVRNIQLSVRARYRVKDLQAKKEQLEKDQAKLKGDLAYVQSDYYAEKVARDELQLGKPGESVVIVPEGVVAAEEKKQVEEPKNLPNYLKWWKVLIGEE